MQPAVGQRGFPGRVNTVDHREIARAAEAARRPTRYRRDPEEYARECERAIQGYALLGGAVQDYHAVPPPPVLSVEQYADVDDVYASWGPSAPHVTDAEWTATMLSRQGIPTDEELEDDHWYDMCQDDGDYVGYDDDAGYGYGGGGYDDGMGVDPYDDGTNYYGDDWGYSEPVDDGYGGYSQYM